MMLCLYCHNVIKSDEDYVAFHRDEYDEFAHLDCYYDAQRRAWILIYGKTEHKKRFLGERGYREFCGEDII